MKIENTDRIIFKKGKQSEFIRLAAKEIGSLRGLARFVNKRWGYFWYYVNEEISLPYNLFESILPMTPLTKDEVMATWVKEVRLRNWGNVIGGKKTGEIVKKKIKEDKKFRERWRKNCRKGGNKLKSKFIKNWDVGFRKAGKRNVIGPKGERMFNRHEKNIALWLLSHDKDYEYERLLKINGRYYFPDFIVENIIIERCGVFTKSYFKTLKRKLNDYRKYWKGKVVIVSPRKFSNNLRTNMRVASNFLMVFEENGLDELGTVLNLGPVAGIEPAPEDSCRL